MTVPKHKRSLSSLQFVQTALDIQELIARITTRFPNRWKHTRTFYYTDLAERIVENCVIANSIYSTNVPECDLRLKHILEAKGLIAVLNTKIDWFLSKNFTIKIDVETKQGTVQEERQLLSPGLAKQVVELLQFEDKLLSGLVKKEREKRRKFCIRAEIY